jgi:proton-translocating NADH-quinone oxidoreductase chain M
MIPLEAVQTPTAIQIPTLLLSAMVWIPAIGAMLLLFFPGRTDAQRDRMRSFALAVTAIVAFFGVVMWYGFREQTGSFGFEETRDWLPSLASSYHLGVDGISMPLLLLSSFLFVFAIVASNRPREQAKEYFMLLLVLETGVNGALASLDFLLFFLFWQLQAVPMFLLVARFGGVRRRYTAWKLLAIELIGSSLLLLAILILYFKAPVHTFDIPTLHDLTLPVTTSLLLTWLFFIAFAARLPIFPFHTWFVDAQAGATAPIALILAGVVVKLGGYGIIRVDVGQFQAAFHKIVGAVVVIAVISILWSAIVALVQDDLRRLVGYIVMSHMGLVLLAAASAAPIALNGAILMMVADGLTAALLVLVAAAIVERVNTSSIRAMGGMATRMTRGAVLGVLAALAAIGFPGLAGFVGQFMIVVGAYPTHRLATPLALLGVLLVAAATILAVQRIFFGVMPEAHGRVRDLGTLELAGTVGLFSLIALLGLLPAILMDSITFSVITLLTRGGA